jgi:hypothetical protein
MANLQASAVTLNTWWYTNSRVNSRRKAVDVTMVLTGQGGTTNKIPAALFGMNSIEECVSLVDSSNNAYLTAPDYLGANLCIMSKPAATVGSVVTMGSNKFIVATGLASAGNITATGVVAGDNIIEALDLTTPSELVVSNFTAGAGVIAQASGAGDIHLLKVRFAILNPATVVSTVTQGAAAPTDITATVRAIIIGKD